tara:strand:+ start:95 stop:388 length:294 start_codon:yes stop_codon:yes gene_type:complete
MNDWLTDIYNHSEGGQEAVCSVCHQKAADGVNIDPFPVCKQCGIDPRRSLKIFLTPQNRHDAPGGQVRQEEGDDMVSDLDWKERLLFHFAKKQAGKS